MFAGLVMSRGSINSSMKNFTGVDDPYEEPEHPELIIESNKETVEESIERIFAKLQELGYLTHADVSADTNEAVADHA